MYWFVQLLTRLMVKKIDPNNPEKLIQAEIEERLVKLISTLYQPLLDGDELDLPIKLYILYQVYSCLDQHEDASVGMDKIETMLIGAAVIAIKVSNDLAVWNEDIIEYWPSLTAIGLYEIEKDHLKKIDYSVTPKCVDLIDIFKPYINEEWVNSFYQEAIEEFFFTTIESDFKPFILDLMQLHPSDQAGQLLSKLLKNAINRQDVDNLGQLLQCLPEGDKNKVQKILLANIETILLKDQNEDHVAHLDHLLGVLSKEAANQLTDFIGKCGIDECAFNDLESFELLLSQDERKQFGSILLGHAITQVSFDELPQVLGESDLQKFNQIRVSNGVHCQQVDAIKQILQLLPRDQVATILTTLSDNEVNKLHSLLLTYVTKHLTDKDDIKQLASLAKNKQIDISLRFLLTDKLSKLQILLRKERDRHTLFAANPVNKTTYAETEKKDKCCFAI